jgi:predicted nuclease with RNAse H fold
VLTVGIDLAAEADHTAVAHISWHGGKATVTHLVTRADDDAVLDSIMRADKAGIDCPLGWPDAFVRFVAEHQDGQLAPPSGGTGRSWRQTFTNRVTDLEVRREIKLVPLSVSADRIAHVALRCAGILARLAALGSRWTGLARAQSSRSTRRRRCAGGACRTAATRTPPAPSYLAS